MKNENNRIKRHRGSSPPSQDESQGSFDFLEDYSSTSQNSDITFETQVHKQQRFKTNKTINQEFDRRQTKNAKNGRHSFDVTESQQDIDDGGED